MANRYWVGGTGTWDTTATTNWSTASGGASGASVPTAADSVFFDQAGTYTVTMTGAIRSLDFTMSAGTVTFALGTTPTLQISGSLSLTPAANWASTAAVTFNATTSATLSASGVTFGCPFTFNGPGGSWVMQSAITINALRTVTLTAGTLDLNGYSLTCGLFVSNNVNTRTLAFGSAGVTVTGVGGVWNFGTVTGLTYTGNTTVNVTSAGSTAITVANGTGGAAEALAVSYNFTGGTYALTLSGTANNINFTGFAGTASNSLLFIYGSLTLSTGWNRTAGGNAWIFRASTGPKTITTVGRTLDFPLTFSATASAGSWQLQDALTMGSTRDVAMTNGTLDLNGKTLTTGAFGTNAGTKDLTFNGGSLVLIAVSTANFAQSFTNANPTGFTTTAGTGAGRIVMAAATAKTFTGGGSTFNCQLYATGNGNLTITGSNTFSDIDNSRVGPAISVLFAAGSTNTFAAFSMSGTAAFQHVIGSATAGTQFTLSKASGTVNVSYCTISDSAATGGATWNALTSNGNVDGGNNTGWNFGAVSYTAGGNFMAFF